MDGSFLKKVRQVLNGAMSVTINVAFVQARGVHLIEKELRSLQLRGIQVRMLVTTTFATTNQDALALAHHLGASIKVLNPGGSSYHPKVFMAESGHGTRAVVGSANLTGGLATNIEIGIWMDDADGSESMKRLHHFSEQLWDDPRAQFWQPEATNPVGVEKFQEDLFKEILEVKRTSPTIRTLGPKPRENILVEVSPTEVLVETSRTRQRGGTPSSVPAWMFNLAWDYLRLHGQLTNTLLLNELRVHRSSAICAIFARFTTVAVVPGRVITLKWTGPEVEPDPLH